MPTVTAKFLTAAMALAISACVVSAQTAPAPAPKAPAAAPKTAEPKKSFVPKKATTPAGIKCSADADAQNLHGKERRKFRSTCIRAFKKAEAAKKT